MQPISFELCIQCFFKFSLMHKKEIQPGQGLEAVSEKFASFILSAPDRFNTAVLQYNTPAAQ